MFGHSQIGAYAIGQMPPRAFQGLFTLSVTETGDASGLQIMVARLKGARVTIIEADTKRASVGINLRLTG